MDVESPPKVERQRAIFGGSRMAALIWIMPSDSSVNFSADADATASNPPYNQPGRQHAQGDRHLYASRTRFIPEKLLGLFEQTAWPLAPAGTAARPAGQGQYRSDGTGAFPSRLMVSDPFRFWSIPFWFSAHLRVFLLWNTTKVHFCTFLSERFPAFRLMYSAGQIAYG